MEKSDEEIFFEDAAVNIYNHRDSYLKKEKKLRQIWIEFLKHVRHKYFEVFFSPEDGKNHPAPIEFKSRRIFYEKLIKKMTYIFTDILHKDDRAFMPELKNTFLNVLDYCRQDMDLDTTLPGSFVKLDIIYDHDFLTNNFMQEGIAELVRCRIEEGRRKESKIIAHGITAFLSSETEIQLDYGKTVASLRMCLRCNAVIDAEDFFMEYFDHCLKFFQKKEQEEVTIRAQRKTKEELARIHYASELNILSQPQDFYDEIEDNTELSIVAEIKKVAEYYPEWIKEHFLIEENEHGLIIFQQAVLRKFYLTFDNYLWPSVKYEVFEKWFWVEPEGKPELENDMITYFAYAIWKIWIKNPAAKNLKTEFCTDINKWYKSLMQTTNSISNLKNAAVDPKKSEIDAQLEKSGIF